MNFVKKNYKWLLGILLIVGMIVLYRSFGSKAPLTQYETTKIGSGTVQATVSVVGSITPQKELKLAFQNSGKIQSIKVIKGQRVSSGQVLAEINTDDIKSQITRDEAAVSVARAQLTKVQQGIKLEDKKVLETSVANAQKTLNQAKITYASTQASAAADIALSELQLNNAQKVYDATAASNTTVNTKDIAALEASIANATQVLSATERANKENVKSSQASLDGAEVTLNNAKKNLQTGTPVQDKNVSKAQEESFYSSVNYLNEVDNSLRAMNNILTVEEYNKDQNKAYKEVLGVQKMNSYNDTLSSYYSLKEQFIKNKELFVITSRTLSYAEIVARLEVLKTLLDTAYTSLTVTYDLLSNSLTSQAFSQASLDAFRTSILSQRTLTTNALSAISNTKKNVESLELQRTSNVTTFQNAIDSAQKSYDSAKQNLENVKAQSALSETNARNSLRTAQDNLEKTKAGLSGKELTVLNTQNALASAGKNLENSKAKADAQIQNAHNTLITSESQLANAQAQLTAQSSPARQTDIDVQLAQVKQAEASLAITKTKLSQTSLLSPGVGTVTKIPMNEGEQAGPSTAVITMISEDVNIIEANVSETEIGKVRVGQSVLIDFDAFSINNKYHGTLSFIDQDKTIQDGVISYRVQITFSQKEFPENLARPGMTANLNIVTSELAGVPFLSNQALKEEYKDGKSTDYVEVLEKKDNTQKIVKKYVQVGVRGDDKAEILSGLSDQDEVILFVKATNG